MKYESHSGTAAFIGAFLIGVILLYIGGWHVLWAKHIATHKSLYIAHGFAIEFNHRYYGFLFNSRFFNSPVVSWIMGAIAFSVFSAGLKQLFADNDEDEDEDEGEDGQPNKAEN